MKATYSPGNYMLFKVIANESLLTYSIFYVELLTETSTPRWTKETQKKNKTRTPYKKKKEKNKFYKIINRIKKKIKHQVVTA